MRDIQFRTNIRDFTLNCDHCDAVFAMGSTPVAALIRHMTDHDASSFAVLTLPQIKNVVFKNTTGSWHFRCDYCDSEFDDMDVKMPALNRHAILHGAETFEVFKRIDYANVDRG